MKSNFEQIQSVKMTFFYLFSDCGQFSTSKNCAKLRKMVDDLISRNFFLPFFMLPFLFLLQCNLAAPDGVRGALAVNGDSGNESDNEINDSEDTDRIRYKEVLATIGALGREAPDHR